MRHRTLIEDIEEEEFAEDIVYMNERFVKYLSDVYGTDAISAPIIYETMGEESKEIIKNNYIEYRNGQNQEADSSE